MKLINPYSTEEGLRRFRQIASDTTRQFERERREPSIRSEPGDVPSMRSRASQSNVRSGIRPSWV